ncbi:DUF222 domain-containing protein, partial [Actinomycetospora sp. TBRC 11914]|uniref:DUF222 domain-containing protein n=1 Tax=Actinomycetospora sp. TBRC 11914 TaxID=2729387 RepID=UPI00145E106A
ELAALLARLGELADSVDAVPDPVRIDRIALLEQTRAALAAAQHTEMVAFAGSQVAAHEAEIAAGRLDPRKLGTGIADQIALAAHVSPWQGSRRLSIARALATDLPQTRRLLASGRISEALAEKVVSETSHLDADARRLVDKQLADAGLDEQGLREAEATVKRTAYEVDRAGYTHRGRTARKDRRVTLRPAPDTMAVLSGLLPVEQGVACLAALRRHADSLVATGDTDGRSRDQVMADTLVERLTGQAHAEDVDVEVGIVLPLDALLDPDSATPGELVGHGPLPAGIVRDLLRATGGKRWWRRLFAHPAHGGLLGGDPQKRRFDGFLARLIDLRDGGRCRDPYCDAPIRHHDHIVQSRAGGPASLANGRGVCARGNYVREMPGWDVETVHDGHGEHPHTVRTTTPTGHTYTSRAGP